MAYHNIENWKPQKRTADILNRAMEHIESVLYTVSVRWVFYRLLQEGIYSIKDDYQTFTALTSRARHSEWSGWHPTTLADDTREMIIHHNTGWEPGLDVNCLIEKAKEEAEREREQLRREFENYEFDLSYTVDPVCCQAYNLIIMYEARAMTAQFQTYAQGFTLCPFAGQPSIPYKYEIAKHIERQFEKYEKPMVVIYFGDLDKGGMEIFETGQRDISKWCDAPITWTRAGLTMEQIEKYNIPENFQHPGAYQWEALDDGQAREIILDAIGQFWDFEAVEAAQIEAQKINEIVNEAVNQ